MGMYDDDQGYDDLDDRGSRNGGGLRKQLEEALARVNKLTEENGKLRTQVTTTTLRDVLQEKGLRPGLARLMTKDGVDASDKKAVEDWLTDPSNQEDFGFALGADGKSPAQPQTQEIPANSAAADFAAFQNAQANALPADPTKLAEAGRLLDSASSDEEILAALQTAMPR